MKAVKSSGLIQFFTSLMIGLLVGLLAGIILLNAGRMIMRIAMEFSK